MTCLSVHMRLFEILSLTLPLVTSLALVSPSPKNEPFVKFLKAVYLSERLWAG